MHKARPEVRAAHHFRCTGGGAAHAMLLLHAPCCVLHGSTAKSLRDPQKVQVTKADMHWPRIQL